MKTQKCEDCLTQNLFYSPPNMRIKTIIHSSLFTINDLKKYNCFNEANTNSNEYICNQLTSKSFSCFASE